jgi:hypothetical protein
MKNFSFSLTFILLIISNIAFNFVSRCQEAILLNLPYDGDTIHTKNPVLTWSVLGNLPIDSEREYYQLTLVELATNQDAATGILMNPPRIRRERLMQQQLMYPFDAPALQYGKRYGWQVQKVMNNAIVDQSEAWEFTLILPPENTPQYYLMKHVEDGAVYSLQEGKLYFMFQEDYQLEELKFRLLNDRRQVIAKNIIFNEEDGQYAQEINVKKIGDNYFKMVIGSSLPIGIYLLEVRNGKNQRYLLKFQV